MQLIIKLHVKTPPDRRLFSIRQYVPLLIKKSTCIFPSIVYTKQKYKTTSTTKRVVWCGEQASPEVVEAGPSTRDETHFVDAFLNTSRERRGSSSLPTRGVEQTSRVVPRVNTNSRLFSLRKGAGVFSMEGNQMETKQIVATAIQEHVNEHWTLEDVLARISPYPQ